MPPWPPVTFQRSGVKYYFPFRLSLEPVRAFRESLVKPQFAYVAENLLLRGGYGKTHFQADQTTLQTVSSMGQLHEGHVESYSSGAATISPAVAGRATPADPPQIYKFQEVVLQALVKKHLRQSDRLDEFMRAIALDLPKSSTLEVLGERALPEGHIDVLLRDATPIGTANMVAIEVKLGTLQSKDLSQLERYTSILGSECRAGVLIGRKASRNVVSLARNRGLHIFFYDLNALHESGTFAVSELLSAFRLECMTLKSFTPDALASR